ncbi:MAG: 16S rRNA (cytidine(1402)-2'-O)-methyltransferase [Myxococcota bacterium]
MSRDPASEVQADREPDASSGELWLVATPIGHLDDVSDRVRRSLQDADAVLAEDTRVTRGLLSHLGIRGQSVERFDAHVEHRASDRILDRLAGGARLALVSDAGTPAVSDPGARLVAEAAARGVTVTPIVGPSAVVAAVAAAGFAGDRFRFLGFWPRTKRGRREAVALVASTPESVVFFEAPTRLTTTLRELAARVGSRPAVVARELTKRYETIHRGCGATLAEHEGWRGEVTVVVGPHEGRRAGAALAADEAAFDVEARVVALRGEGLRDRDIARALSLETGWTSSDAYRRVIAIARGPGVGSTDEP